jgi:hypothetical protein
MTNSQAIKIAIFAIEKIRRPFAFNANLFKNGVFSESTQLSVKEYDLCSEAIKILKETK